MYSFLKIILLVIQTLLIIIPLTSKDVMYDRRFSKKFWKGISVRGYIFFGLAIIGIVISMCQNKIADDMKEEADNLNKINTEEFRKALYARDSINQIKNEQSSYKTKEMLAKYGFKVDSTNQQIVKTLKDSSLRKTTIFYGESPFLTICDLNIKRQDSLWLEFSASLCSKEAASYNLNISQDIIAYNPTKKTYTIIRAQSRMFLPNTMSIAKDEEWGTSFSVQKPDKENRRYFFRLSGTYYKYDKTPIILDRMFFYDLDIPNETKWGLPSIMNTVEVGNILWQRYHEIDSTNQYYKKLYEERKKNANTK